MKGDAPQVDRTVRDMLPTISLALFFAFTPVVRAVPPGHADDAWAKSEGQVARRDFFALTAMADDVEVRHALSADPILTLLQQTRDAKLRDAVATCHDAKCFDDAFRWSEADIATVAGALQGLATRKSVLGQFIEETLRGSGRFALYEQQTKPELVVSAWNDAANAMNRIFAVYGEGTPPLYARIDSMSYDPKSTEFVESLQGSVASIAAEESPQRPFFFAARC